MASKVLVIDDSPLVLSIVRETLEDAGYAVETAEDGQIGLSCVESFHPDVVLCDMQMPKLSGAEVVATIKQRYPETPVLIFTETRQVSTAVTAMRSGAFAYLVKGESDAMLVREVEGALKHRADLERARVAEEGNRRYQEQLEKRVQEKIEEILRLHEVQEEEAASANEALVNFHTVIAQTPQSVVILLGQTIRHVNPALRKMLGFPESWTNDDRFPLQELRECLRPLIDAFADDAKDAPEELSLRHRSGRPVVVESQGLPLVIDGERARLILIKDVTEKKEVRASLMQMDRLAAVGTLAAGVAHEINNPLSYVQSNLAFLDDELSSLRGSPVPPSDRVVDDLKDAIAESQQGIDRVALIVRDLNGFSRQTEERLLVELREVIESTIRIAGPSIRQRAQLAVQVSDLRPVLGNSGRLGQLILNLLVNAGQAIPESAKNAGLIILHAYVKEPWVVLEVQDNGTGIKPDIKARLFEPFFTTKAPGEGTGLGLSICHTIVSSHGGKLEVESNEGEGALFRVSLPIARAVQGA